VEPEDIFTGCVISVINLKTPTLGNLACTEKVNNKL
jgi:hypothetical protein